MGYPHFRFIQSYVHHGRVGVLVEFGVESDFVTKTPEFVKLSQNIAMHIAGMNPADVDALLKQPFVLDETRTVAAVLAEAQVLFKENIVVRRFARWDSEQPDDRPDSPPRNPAVAMRLGRRA